VSRSALNSLLVTHLVKDGEAAAEPAGA
jgi:hypothetical protein